MSAINPQIRTRHKSTRITNQEHRRTPILLRRRQPAQHILRRPRLAPIRELLEQLLDHGSDDVARRDGVDADCVRAPFGGEIAAELNYGGFGGIVGWADEALGYGSLVSLSFGSEKGSVLGTHSVRDGSAHAGDHDDTASISKSNHLLRDCLRRHKDARHIHGEHCVRVFSSII